MAEYQPIYGAITRPQTTLPKYGRICKRCGIEYETQTSITHCTDCRLVMRTPKRYRPLKTKATP